MASFASEVSTTQSAEFFARFGRLAGSGVRARRLLALLLGDDQAMGRALAAADVTPCGDMLWQTPKQAAGGSCTLQELLDAAPEGLTHTIDWYLEDTSRIPEEWKGRAIFFRNSEFRDGDGDRCVRYLYWGGGRWDRACYWVGSPVNGHAFLAVPVSAL